MSRDLPAPFLTAAQAVTLKPVWLLAINTGLSSPNDVLRYCSGSTQITFPDGGDVYTPRGWEGSRVIIDVEQTADQTIIIPDADGAIRALNPSFPGQKVVLTRIDRTQTSSDTYAQTDVFIIENDGLKRHEIVLEVVQRRFMFEIPTPLRPVIVDEFPGVVQRG